MRRAAYVAVGAAATAAVGVLLAWRLAGATHVFQDYFLMLSSVAIGVAVLAVLAAVRAHGIVWVTYAYLATPFFANRLLGEVWLGSPEERAAGTVAPFLFGDLVLLYVLVKQRRSLHAWLFLFAAFLLIPFAAQLYGAPLEADAFFYQYLVLVRGLLIVWLATATVGGRDTKKAGDQLVYHLGVIFGGFAFVTSSAALISGQRFGLPGWGTNVYANALCLVGILSLMVALRRRNLFLKVVSVLCLLGIIGSGTRVALVIFLATALSILVVRMVPRPLSVIAIPVIAVGALGLFVMFPGALLGAVTDLTARGQTVGGVQLDSSVSLPQLFTAVSRESSVRTRLQLWETSAAMFRQHPITGVGWGQWNWRKAEFGFGQNVLLDPHNGYVWLLAEGGLAVAAVVFLGILVLLWRSPRSAFYLAFVLILLLEVTNANVQKSLYSVLAGLIIGIMLAQRKRRRIAVHAASPTTASIASPSENA